MGYHVSSLDGARRRATDSARCARALGVTAFGVNATRLPAALRRAEPLPRPRRTSSTSSTAARRRSRSTARSTWSARAASCTSSRRRTAHDLEPHRRRPRAAASSAARTATSSATATSSIAEIDLASASDRELGMNGPDDGLPADAADAPAARRDVLRRQGDRHPAARQELPPLHVRRRVPPRRAQLAVALQGLGLERGDRVATLCWNHYQHLEAYFGIPCGGFVLHTLNLRLHPNDLAYIATHAGDRP